MARKNLDLPPRLTSPETEVDITDYQRQPSAYTQSTEESLASDTHLEPNDDSASVCTRSTLATQERPVSWPSEDAVNLTDAPVEVPVISLPPIRLELAELEIPGTAIEQAPTTSNHRQYDGNFLGQVGFASPRNDDGIREVPTSSPPGVSEDDIELEDLALPPAGTRSTEHLVPPPVDNPEPTDRPEPQHDLHNSGSSDRVGTKPVGPRAIPNYKPPALRWPFQVFIVAIIAGLFGFLEYQVHDLPPPHYKALQLDLKKGGDTHSILPAATRTTTETVLTPALQARPLPKSPVVATTTTHIQNEDSYTLDHGRALKARKPFILAPEPTPDPRPPKTEYPPGGLITAYCGWHRPRWKQDGFVANRPEWPSVYHFSSIQEQISVFTTTDPTWCPCTISKGGFGFFFPASWDTNDDGCRSVMNLISTMNTPDYKNHVWHYQPVTGSYNSVKIVTEPPSSIAVPWGYPTINSNGEVIFPLEVRSPKFELRDVFGNLLADRNTTATFPVSYRWKPDEIGLIKFNEEWDDPEEFPFSSAYLAGPTTPCVTDIREIDALINTHLFDVPLGACPDKVESYKTVFWTLPYGRPLSSSNTTTADTVLPTSSTVSTRTGEDGTSATNFEATSKSILPASTPLGSTPGTTNSVTSMEVQPFPSTSPNMLTSTTAGQDENTRTLRVTQTSKGTNGETSQEGSEVPTSSAAGVGESEWPSSGSLSVPSVEKSSDAPFAGGNTNEDTTSGQRESHNIGPEHAIPTTEITPVTETFLTEAQSSGSLSASYLTTLQIPDSETTQTVKTQVTDDVSVSPSPNWDDHAATNSTKTLKFTLRPGPTVIVHSTTATEDNPLPNFTMRPSWGGPISPEDHDKFFNLNSEADYLMVSLVPVLLATLLGIPVQIFVASLNSMLPFRALTNHKQPGGSYANTSLHQPRAPPSWSGPKISYRFWARFRDPLPLFAVLLETLSTLLVPLSTETIRVEFTSMGCKKYKIRLVCAYGLRKVEAPIRVVEAMLIIMAVLVVAMGYLLSRWRTGVATEPWSIASMAGLLRSSDEEVQTLLRKIPNSDATSGRKCLHDKQIIGPFQDRRYRLGFHHSTSAGIAQPGDGNEEPKYGLYLVPATEDNSPVRPTVRDPKTREPVAKKKKRKKKWMFWQHTHMQTSSRQTGTRLITLLFIIGLLVLIMYYENTVSPDTAFERFMDSQTFGVRLLFTSFGTAVSGLWSYHFSQTAESQIYDRLSTPKPARESILLSPPSDVFTGLWRFSYFRTKDILSFNITFAALLAKFTPILFSNIPFRNTVTWRMHEACTWMAAAVLGYMVLVLVTTLLVQVSFGFGLGFGFVCLGGLKWGRTQEKLKRLDMPVRADTMLGYMYYLVESKMVDDLGEGAEMLSPKERDRLVDEMGRLYVLGEVEKEGGQRRMVVDYFPVGSVVQAGESSAKQAVQVSNKAVSADVGSIP